MGISWVVEDLGRTGEWVRSRPLKTLRAVAKYLGVVGIRPSASHSLPYSGPPWSGNQYDEHGLLLGFSMRLFRANFIQPENYYLVDDVSPRLGSANQLADYLGVKVPRIRRPLLALGQYPSPIGIVHLDTTQLLRPQGRPRKVAQ